MLCQTINNLTWTLGDLGSNPKDVETALQTNFALANRWGCILLLDEADVFLAERRREDFNRNGLVAGTSSSDENLLKSVMLTESPQFFSECWSTTPAFSSSQRTELATSMRLSPLEST